MDTDENRIEKQPIVSIYGNTFECRIWQDESFSVDKFDIESYRLFAKFQTYFTQDIHFHIQCLDTPTNFNPIKAKRNKNTLGTTHK